MVEMKFSRTDTDRITFQSVVDSPNSRQMDSKAILTGGGGFDIDLTSTRFCFLIDCTAEKANELFSKEENKKNVNKTKKCNVQWTNINKRSNKLESLV
jgi:hypothetical protein